MGLDVSMIKTLNPMDFHLVISDEWVLPESRFDNSSLISERVEQADPGARTAVGLALRYLYLTAGPTNLPRKRMLAAVSLLEPRERRAIRWMYTRTNGSERKNYGPSSVVAMRKARFRCERCGFPDVRALQVDHKTGRTTKPFQFQCLCGNCHSMETYHRTQVSPAPAQRKASPAPANE